MLTEHRSKIVDFGRFCQRPSGPIMYAFGSACTRFWPFSVHNGSYPKIRSIRTHDIYFGGNYRYVWNFAMNNARL